MAIREIPATRRIGRVNMQAEDCPLLRVAAYCRVSTELEEQESSYSAQVRHYTEYILGNPAWKLAGIFADEGISGTGTKKREEFNRMIQCCLDGEIDMIITKSISRFARNTLDCLKYIRLLKDRRIPVFFEKENINTLDAKGEVLITIMASLAQQESQSISQNVRMGIQYQYQQGRVRVNHNWFLGYTKDAQGRLVIVPEQADVVRRIYREFLGGRSTRQIARGLEADGILTGAGRTKWYDSTVRTILTNEKYMGDALLQKYYTVDFLTKKKSRNNGELPQYYVENDHAPIISREEYQQVQAELQHRANQRSESGMREQYSGKYALSGILICDRCGSSYRRMKANGTNKTTTWRCKKRLQRGTPCHGRNVPEEEVHTAVLMVLNRLAADRLSLEAKAEQILNGSLAENTRLLHTLETQIAQTQKSITEYTKLRTAGTSTPEQDLAMRHRALELNALRKKKRTARENKAAMTAEYQELSTLLEYLRSHAQEGPHPVVPSYEEDWMSRLLKEVRVLEDGYRITLKCGIEHVIPTPHSL